MFEVSGWSATNSFCSVRARTFRIYIFNCVDLKHHVKILKSEFFTIILMMKVAVAIIWCSRNIKQSNNRALVNFITGLSPTSTQRQLRLSLETLWTMTPLSDLVSQDPWSTLQWRKNILELTFIILHVLIIAAFLKSGKLTTATNWIKLYHSMTGPLNWVWNDTSP